MDYIAGFTFGFLGKTGDLKKQSAKISLHKLIEETNCNTITIPLIAMQDTLNSIDVQIENEYMYSEEEYIEFVNYAQTLGLKVIVKAMVNVYDGSWRGLINFINPDVKCEPTWRMWFDSYIKFTNYCAEIAQKTNAYMYCIGCEMVCSNSQTQLYEELIKQARARYQGLITYNCDKYQEDRIEFWDKLDVISSSGYYPQDSIELELKRIEKVVKKYNKPFFFMECGCPSRIGSETNPNNYKHEGKTDVNTQKIYIKTLIEECEKTDFVSGYTWWDWKIELYIKEQGIDDSDYTVWGKPASNVIKEAYTRRINNEYLSN